MTMNDELGIHRNQASIAWSSTNLGALLGYVAEGVNYLGSVILGDVHDWRCSGYSRLSGQAAAIYDGWLTDLLTANGYGVALGEIRRAE